MNLPFVPNSVNANEVDPRFGELLSFQIEKGKYLLSGIIKQTYLLEDDGKCTPHPEMLPLVQDYEFYDPEEEEMLKQDADVYPFKQFTDLVIKGNANSPVPTSSFTVSVSVGKIKNAISVFGDRKAQLLNSGEIIFTPPELLKSVPLRYDYAYGGTDYIVELLSASTPEMHEVMDMLEPGDDPFSLSYTRYLRNPKGRGFVIGKFPEAFENFLLPNLEDPEDLLNPERLIVNDPKKWYDLPIPRATDWLSIVWFPRIAYSGFLQPMDVNFKEVRRNWVEKDILASKPESERSSIRFANGASLGFQLPYLQPGETILLENIHPRISKFTLQLPKEYPEIWVDGRKGKLLPTKPVMHTVLIEPEEKRLSIVWSGIAPAIRPYHEMELKTMPFKVNWKSK